MIVVVSITCLLAASASKLRVEVSPDEQLPQEHPYVIAFREVHRLFGDKDLLVIALTPITGDIVEGRFLRAVQRVAAEIRDLPGCVKPLLQGLGSPSTKTMSLSPDGLRVEPLLRKVPETENETDALRRTLGVDRHLHGSIISHDGRSVALYATFEPHPDLSGYVAITERVKSILDSEATGVFQYRLSGPVAIVAALTTYAGRALLLFPVALGVIGAIHFVAFRTWQAILLPLATGILGVVWALGLMGLFSIPLDPFNSTTPILILAVGTGHAVQILSRYYELIESGLEASRAIVDAVCSTGQAMIAACLIATLSFFSLTTLGTESMRRFGSFTALGIVSTLAIELTLVPALRAMLRPPPRRTSSSRSRRRSTVMRVIASLVASPRRATLVLLIYAGGAAACITLALHLSTDSSFVRQFAANHPVRREDAFINEHFSGANVLLFVITAPPGSTLATPLGMNAIERFAVAVAQLPGVGKVVAVTDTLSRIQTALMPAARDSLPQTAELLSQYLFLYSLSGGDELSTVITPDYRSTKVVALMREDSTTRGAETIARIRTVARTALPPTFSLDISGTIASNLALTETMVRGKLLNICQISLITTAISACLFGSLVGGLLVAMPLAFAVIFNFGVMSAAGIPLDVGTAAVSAMAVGIGADYTIYFLLRLREEIAATGDLAGALLRTIDTAGGAIVLVASAVGCGYAVLCFAGYQLYVCLGLLIALAMATSSIASLTAVPAVIVLLAQTGRLPAFLRPRTAKTIHLPACQER